MNGGVKTRATLSTGGGGHAESAVRSVMRFEDHEAARRWKRATLAQLSARIRIEESILRSLRKERAELVELHGQKLTARFGWESDAELEFLYRDDLRFRHEIEDLFIDAELRGTTAWKKIG